MIGRLAEIVGARQRSRYEHVPIPDWRHTADSHLIRLEPTLVSGRRLNGGGPRAPTLDVTPGEVADRTSA